MRKQVEEEEVPHICEKYLEGYGIATLANMFKVRCGTLERILRENNVPMRKGKPDFKKRNIDIKRALKVKAEEKKHAKQAAIKLAGELK